LRTESNKSHILGLIIPDIQNPFFAEVARGVEDVAYSHEYAVLLCNSDETAEKEKFYLETMRSEYVDGIILPPVDERDEAVAHLIKNNIAVVCVDRSVSTIPVDTVEVDNQNGAYEATKLLIKLGHRRIGFVSGRPNISTTRERRQGYEDALVAHGLTLDEGLVRVGDSKLDSGRVLTGELLDLPQRPTALFIGNNLMTLGALVAIHQRRLHIPSEIALVGFDDFPSAESLDPPLTVVRQPAYQVGRKAAELLLQRLAEPRQEPFHIRLVPELVIRQSCGSPEKQDEGVV
jgi:LacI family transcriptional regulator/LacI family repressor for deo operon, udp, cdd, tsx, nupC, and nupG